MTDSKQSQDGTQFHPSITMHGNTECKGLDCLILPPTKN